MAEENSSRVETDTPAVMGDVVSGLPSFNQRIVIGGSPLMTEQRILARDPSSRKRGKEKGSITGGPGWERQGIVDIRTSRVEHLWERINRAKKKEFFLQTSVSASFPVCRVGRTE